MPITNPRDPAFEAIDREQQLLDLGMDPRALDEIRGPRQSVEMDTLYAGRAQQNPTERQVNQLGRYDAMMEALHGEGLTGLADRLSVESMETIQELDSAGYHASKKVREHYRDWRSDTALSAVQHANDKGNAFQRTVANILGSDAAQITLGGVEPLMRGQQVVYGLITGEGGQAWSRMFPKVMVQNEYGEEVETSPFAATVDAIWSKLSGDEEGYEAGMLAVRQANEQHLNEGLMEFRDVVDVWAGPENMDELYLNMYQGGIGGKLAMAGLATLYAGAEIFVDPLLMFEKVPGATYSALRGMASSSYKATSAVKKSLKTNRLPDIFNSIEAAGKHLDIATVRYNENPTTARLKNLKNAYNLYAEAVDHVRLRSRGEMDTALVPQVPRRAVAPTVRADLAVDLGEESPAAFAGKTGWERGIAIMREKGLEVRDSTVDILDTLADTFGPSYVPLTELKHLPQVQAITEIADRMGIRAIFGASDGVGHKGRNIFGVHVVDSRVIALDFGNIRSYSGRRLRALHHKRKLPPPTQAEIDKVVEAELWTTAIHELQHAIWHQHLSGLNKQKLLQLVGKNADLKAYVDNLFAKTGMYDFDVTTPWGRSAAVDEGLARALPEFLTSKALWKLMMEEAPETGAHLLDELVRLNSELRLVSKELSITDYIHTPSGVKDVLTNLWGNLLDSFRADQNFVALATEKYAKKISVSLERMKANKAILESQGIKTPLADDSIERIEGWLKAIEEGNLQKLEEYQEILYEAATVLDTNDLARLAARDRLSAALKGSSARQSNMTKNWYKDKDGNWVEGEFMQPDLDMPVSQPAVTERSLPAGMNLVKTVDEDGNIRRVVEMVDNDGTPAGDIEVTLGDYDVGVAFMTIDDILEHLGEDLATIEMNMGIEEVVAAVKRFEDHGSIGTPTIDVVPQGLDTGGPVRLVMLGGGSGVDYAHQAKIKLMAMRAHFPAGGDMVVPIAIRDFGGELTSKHIDMPSAIFDEQGRPIKLRGYISKREPDALRKQLHLERMDRIANGPDQAEFASTGLSMLVDGADPDDIMVLLSASPERRALTGGRIVPGTVAGMIDMDAIERHIARVKAKAKEGQMELWEYSPQTARLEDAMLATRKKKVPYDKSWLPEDEPNRFADVNSQWFNEHQENFFQRIGRGLDPESWQTKAPSWLYGTIQFMREPMRALEEADPGVMWPIVRGALYDAENETIRLKAVFNDAMVRFGALERKKLNKLSQAMISGGKADSYSKVDDMSALLFDLLDEPEGSEAFIRLVEMHNITDDQLKAVMDIRNELNIIAEKLGIAGSDRMIGDNGYIHHAFDHNWYAKGEILPENAGLSANGNVFLAALLRRNGAAGFTRDAAAVLDLYSRGVARKLYIEPGLNRFIERAKKVAKADPKRAYVLDYADMVVKQLKGEPTMLGSLVDKVAGAVAGRAGRAYQPGDVSRKIMAMSGLIYSSLLAGNRRYPIMSIATALATTGAQFGMFRTLKGMFKAATPEGQMIFKAIGGDVLWEKIFEGGRLADGSFQNSLIERMLALAPRARLGTPSIQDTENFIRGMTFWASIDEMLTKGGFRNVMEAQEAGILGEILFDALRTTEEVNHYFGVASKSPVLGRTSRSGSVVATQFLSFPYKQGEQLLSMAKGNPGKIGNYLMLSGWISRVGSQELGIDLREYTGVSFVPGGTRDLTSPGVAFLSSAVQMMGQMSALHDGYGDPDQARLSVERFIKNGEVLMPLLGRMKEIANYAEARETGELSIPGLGYSREVDVEFGGIGGYIPIPEGEKGKRSEAVGILSGAPSVGSKLDAAARKKTRQVVNQAAIERLVLADKAWEAMQKGDNEEMVRQLERMRKMGIPIGDISTGVKAKAAAARLHWYMIEIRQNPGLAHKLIPELIRYGVLRETGD